MKKIVFCFLALFTQLFSQDSQMPKLKNWWSWDKSFLYLNLELENGFQFNNRYDRFIGENGEIGAEIHCYPSASNPFFAENGELLEKIIFTVFLSYNPNDHFTNFTIEKKYIYNSEGWILSDTTTSTSVFSGKINNADLDLSALAEFLTDPRFDNRGYFTFTKLTQ